MDIKLINKKGKAKLRTGISGTPVDGILKLANRDIRIFNDFGDRQKERFFSDMALLTASGVDLQAIIELITDSTGKKNIHELYKRIAGQIKEGMSLSDALLLTGKFNQFDCYSVLIGESTGELQIVFAKLASFYKKKIAQKRKITSALSYPAIVLLTTAGAVFFMLRFVVPMFAKTLAQFGDELPYLTRVIVYISNHIGVYLLICICFVTPLIVLYYKNRKKVSVQKMTADFLLRIPYIGALIRDTYTLRFTETMELLIAAQVGLLESIQLTQKMIAFYPLRTALNQVGKEIVNGTPFYKSLEKNAFFDKSMITLVKIGEEVNQLDKIFMQLSLQYESKLEHKTSIMISLLEPVVILFLAVVVGVILISMYLPMFKIGTAIH